MSVNPSSVKSLYIHYLSDAESGGNTKRARFASIRSPKEDDNDDSLFSSSSSQQEDRSRLSPDSISSLFKHPTSGFLLPPVRPVYTYSKPLPVIKEDPAIHFISLASLPQLYDRPQSLSSTAAVTTKAADEEAKVEAEVSLTKRPHFSSLEELAKKMKELGTLPFEARMKALYGMANPVLDASGSTIGVGFQVTIKDGMPGKPPVIIQLFLRKGAYESEIVSESSFSPERRAEEYDYLEGYEIVDGLSPRTESQFILKVRLSLFNGELVNICNTATVSGKEVFALIRGIVPLFKGIEFMYLYDDAKKKFAQLKTPLGEILMVWIKVAAICHPRLQTPYEEHLGVFPARIDKWVLKTAEYGSVELSQRPVVEYRPALEYFSKIKMNNIYPFMKKYPGVAGIVDRIGKTVFSDFEFGSTDHSLANMYSQLLNRSRGTFTVGKVRRAPKAQEIDAAQRNLTNFYNSFFVPWETDSKLKMSDEESTYLKHLNVLAKMRIFQFPT